MPNLSFLFAAVPYSDVTIIALVLGVFFLVVAFYKEIFHRRSPPGLIDPTSTPPKEEEEIVKLSDPFQQADTPPETVSQPSELSKEEPVSSGEKKEVSAVEEKSAFHHYTPNSMFGKENNEEIHGNRRYIWQ